MGEERRAALRQALMRECSRPLHEISRAAKFVFGARSAGQFAGCVARGKQSLQRARPGGILRMQVSRSVVEWRDARSSIAGSIGFVPTMGALHAGHASLLRRSVAENDSTVASIYVNPAQFDDVDDLAAYPRLLDADLELCASLGVDHVFVPGRDEIYADGYRYRIEETEFSRELCGAHRPGHFTGVLTVVMKLLNLVRPHRTYFGEKDFQQCLLIRDMAAAFFLEVDIVACATVREDDGLAMSSRNALLGNESRRLAPEFNRVLRSARRDQAVCEELERLGFAVDYVVTRSGRRFGAVSLPARNGEVRFIDNVELTGVFASRGSA